MTTKIKREKYENSIFARADICMAHFGKPKQVELALYKKRIIIITKSEVFTGLGPECG